MLEKLRDSLIKNSFWLIFANFIGAFLGVIFWILASRYYDPNDIGIISAILSSILLISSISSIGLPTAIIYYLPRNIKDTSKIIDSCIIVSIIISTIFSIIFLSKIDFLSPKLDILENINFAAIFIILTTVTSISNIMTGAFIAGKRSSYHMFKDNIYGIIRIFLLTPFAELGILGLFVSLSVGMFFMTVISFILLYDMWNYIPRIKFDPILKNMMTFSLENYISGIFYNLPRWIFPIMIVNIISEESAGYFYISMTAANLLYGISQAISTSLFAESHNREKFHNNINKSIIFGTILLIPGILFYIIFGKYILDIFDNRYAENAAMTLIILSISSVPLSIINIFNGIKNSQNRVRDMIKINLIIAILTIVLTIPLMRTNGIDGVAIAFLVANTIGAIIIINRIKNPKELLANGTKY